MELMEQQIEKYVEILEQNFQRQKKRKAIKEDIKREIDVLKSKTETFINEAIDLIINKRERLKEYYQQENKKKISLENHFEAKQKCIPVREEKYMLKLEAEKKIKEEN